MCTKNFKGHQQALIKNNIVVAVLTFVNHEDIATSEVLNNFEHDFVVNLCEVQKDAGLGDSWDGSNFNFKMFESWSLGEDLNWHAPIPKPTDAEYWWDELNGSWNPLVVDSPN